MFFLYCPYPPAAPVDVCVDGGIVAVDGDTSIVVCRDDKISSSI